MIGKSFFRQVVWLGFFAPPFVFIILPTRLSASKVVIYFWPPLPPFLTFVDTDCFLPFFVSFAPKQVRFSHSIRLAGSHELNEPTKG